jgi:hypothetical protein
MDTKSILRTALAEHDDYTNTAKTLESLTTEVEKALRDVQSVCSPPFGLLTRIDPRLSCDKRPSLPCDF